MTIDTNGQTARRTWHSPKVERIDGRSAENGLVAVIPEGLAKGS